MKTASITAFRGFILLLCGFISSTVYSQVPDVQQLLTKVSDALRSSNYQGRLTYEHSGKLEVIEIAHAVKQGIEHERVVYLNGPERQVDKTGRSVGCTTLGSQLLGGRIIRHSGLGADFGTVQLNNAYSYQMLGSERVAGHLSWVLEFVPKDTHRHGLILAVDQVSFLPTKILVIASGRKVLERLHFVSLDTDIAFEQAGFDSLSESSSAVDIGTNIGADVDEECADVQSVVSASLWQPQWVPSGFILSNYRYSDKDGHMETYTDGLAAFSVFSKPSDTSSVGFTSGIKKGATVIVMSLLPESSPVIQVSVLGEIPKHTANRILASVKSK